MIIKLYKAVATITVFAIITRILGFLFRIYLSRQLGAEAMGAYQVAISVFIVLLTLTSSGLPLVISRKTATFALDRDLLSQHKLIGGSLILGLVISLAFCLIIFLLQKPISLLFTDKSSLSVLIMLLPAIVFSAIYSTFRGSLWGHKKYTAVSAVELVEQIARIVICVVLLELNIFNKAEMAGLSLSVACLVSAIVCIALYFKNGGRLMFDRAVIKPLFQSSTSITIVRTISTMLHAVIAFIMPMMLIKSGLTQSVAMSSYGAAMGMAFPILYLPSTVIGSLAFALVPELAAKNAQGDKSALRAKIVNALIFSIAVGAFFVPLYAGAGQEIGSFLYANEEAGAFLKNSAWLLIPISIEQITSSVMNSIDLEIKGFTNFLGGTVLLFLSMFFLTKYIGINSLSLGFGLSLCFSSALDIIDVSKKVGMTNEFVLPLVLSVGFAIPCSLLTYFITNLLTSIMHILPATVLGGGIGMLFMGLLLIVFKVLNVSIVLNSRSKPLKSK